jgi:hypothetical protein
MSACIRVFTTVLIGTLAVGAAGRAQPGAKEAKEVRFTNQWTGSVDDESLKKKAPESGVITGAKAFGELFRAWKVRDKVPEVDFAKVLVLVQTTSGSNISIKPRLTKDGNLQVLGLATLDFAPGFRYQIMVIPREGVRTVNGKALPRD